MPKTTKKTKKTTETVQVSGKDLGATVKSLLHRGNVTRIHVKDKENKTIVNIPVTAGIIGSLIAPFAVLLGASVALLAQYTITIEKREE